MNILMIYGKEPDGNVHELAQESRDEGHKVTFASALDLSSYVHEGQSCFFNKNDELERQDLAFLRGLGRGTCERITKRIGVITHLELVGTRIINPVNALLQTRNKFVTACLLARSGIRVPATFVTESAFQAYRTARILKRTVYKPLIGSMGYGSMKFDDPDLAYNAYQSLEAMGRPIVVQQYIPEARKDTRVFVIGGRVAAAMIREAPPGKWKSNVTQGGMARPASIDEELSELSIKATAALGLDYAGVDIAELSGQGYCVLEVNASPSWQELRRTSKVNIAKELLAHATRSS